VTRLLLSALSLLVVCAASASEQIVPWGSDLAVITATLTYFLKAPESGPPKPGGYIAVAPETDRLPESTRYEDYYRELATLERPPPRDAFTSYLERNQQTYPLGRIPSTNRSIRIEKHDEPPWNAVTSSTSKLRNDVILRAPGYSVDGASAFITFYFCCHLEGAQAFYVLRNISGHWTVVSTEYRYGLQPAL